MIYEYKCNTCEIAWDVQRPLKNYDLSSPCPSCNKEGMRLLSVLPMHFRKTHPDIKQDIHELIAGEPASNYTEL